MDELPLPVIHVNLAREFRGGQRQTSMLIRELAAGGVRQRVVVAADGEMQHRLADIPGLDLRPIAPPYWRHLGLLRHGLVHTGGGSALTLAWLANRIFGTRYIFSKRINKPLNDNPVSRDKYRRAAIVVGVCRGAAAAVQAALPEVPTRVIYSVTAGFRSDPAQVAARRARWPDRFVCINLAALDAEQKGQVYLLEAARRLAREAPAVQFVLCGDGKDAARLRAMAADLPNVAFEGHVNNVGDYLAASDAFVFPSLQEGLGTSLLDGMAFGLPVVSSACDGMVEIVEHERTGLLIPPRDSAAIADAVLRLYRDAALRVRLAEAGRRFSAQFTPALMAARYLEVYREVLQAQVPCAS